MASAVGSMPHEAAAKAVDVVMAPIPEAPIWPQPAGASTHGESSASEKGDNVPDCRQKSG